jgi:hypothetical protein
LYWFRPTVSAVVKNGLLPAVTRFTGHQFETAQQVIAFPMRVHANARKLLATYDRWLSLGSEEEHIE